MADSQMRALVDRHMSAEGQGDIDGAVAVYTDDIEHDVVGFPNGPTRGKDGARGFYAYLTANFRSESWNILHRYVAGDAMILEMLMTGTVIGSLLGLPGNGRRISFRMLHVFEFRDGLISRENVWLDTAAVVSQLD
ncbi:MULTISPECIES: nuclear transport factor 2 family protein [Mycobacterium]|nr:MULTISPECIES: nuclear transport factor 2 family protein [Mycobacterium]ASL15646.1 putative ester cyclase [Mycobacterium intracellulare subsp. chimaera]ASL21766.1 putative ester cyclase [Mycobacterium intracellulare subsp. chimaera]MCF1814971.1 nuclear transport factor 2 family protein [Mycobacterium intracellulare subsp. intracellulare]MDM3897877.1 nuclear transport factor 2 family protein [Mycobacterium intracellulare]MDM3909299.1 nuclear transport factor 2 family protein [Mycobacterium in